MVRLSAIIEPEKVPRLSAPADTPESVIRAFKFVLSVADITPARDVVADGNVVSVPVEENKSILDAFNVCVRLVAGAEPIVHNSKASYKFTLSLYSWTPRLASLKLLGLLYTLMGIFTFFNCSKVSMILGVI
jgi:hypothetical protein